VKASEAKVQGFLRKPTQFTIPICQRMYSWTDVPWVGPLGTGDVEAGMPSMEGCLHVTRASQQSYGQQVGGGGPA